MSPESAAGALRRSTREPEAFARFYDDHAEALLAYLAKRVFDADAALDLTAETFAQAYLARQRFRGSTDEAAAALLYTIAKRQLARYFRKGRAERRALRRLGIEPPRLDEEQQARIEELAGSPLCEAFYEWSWGGFPAPTGRPFSSGSSRSCPIPRSRGA